MKKKNVFKKMVRVSSQKYPLLMASIFFFEKSILKTIQFWIQENPMKKKTYLTKMVRVSTQKYPLLMASFFFLKNPFWNNPILNTGKSNMKKNGFKKEYIYSLTQKISSQQSAPSSTHCRAPAPQNV